VTIFSRQAISNGATLKLKEIQMNKLSSALLTFCLMATGSLALAETPKAMDSMEKNSMSKDNTGQYPMKKDAMDQGSMKKDTMEKGAMTKKKHAKKMRKPEQDGKMERGGGMTMERTK
jgi:pentapeptide MXKDX repeat protein